MMTPHMVFLLIFYPLFVSGDRGATRTDNVLDTQMITEPVVYDYTIGIMFSFALMLTIKQKTFG